MTWTVSMHKQCPSFSHPNHNTNAFDQQNDNRLFFRELCVRFPRRCVGTAATRWVVGTSIKSVTVFGELSIVRCIARWTVWSARPAPRLFCTKVSFFSSLRRRYGFVLIYIILLVHINTRLVLHILRYCRRPTSARKHCRNVCSTWGQF